PAFAQSPRLLRTLRREGGGAGPLCADRPDVRAVCRGRRPDEPFELRPLQLHWGRRVGGAVPWRRNSVWQRARGEAEFLARDDRDCNDFAASCRVRIRRTSTTTVRLKPDTTDVTVSIR